MTDTGLLAFLHDELEARVEEFSEQLEEAQREGWAIGVQLVVTLPEEQVEQLAAEGREQAMAALRDRLSPEARLRLAALDGQGRV